MAQYAASQFDETQHPPSVDAAMQKHLGMLIRWTPTAMQLAQNSKHIFIVTKKKKKQACRIKGLIATRSSLLAKQDILDLGSGEISHCAEGKNIR